MAHFGDERAVPGDLFVGVAAGGAAVPPRSLHTERAGSDGASLAGRAAAGSRAAVPEDRRADARLDDDRDPRGALAALRGGRLSPAARPVEDRDEDRLRVAVPAKGRLREPALSLLADAGRGLQTFRSTCRTASSTAASPAPIWCASAVRASASCCGSASAPAGSRSPCRRSRAGRPDRKSTRLNSSHITISY